MNAAGSSATSTTARSSGSSDYTLAVPILRPRLRRPGLERRLDEAEDELRATLAELRELAHGIFPAVLADEGLAIAVETLEASPGPITVHELPEKRLDGAARRPPTS